MIKNKKIWLTVWIALLGIFQFLLDKYFLPDISKIEYREIELYQPRADLQYRLTNLFSKIRNAGYYQALNIRSQERKIDLEYVNTLLQYHDEIIQLYQLTKSNEIILSIEEMGRDLSRVISHFESRECLGDITADFEHTSKELPRLMGELTKQQQHIIAFDKKLRAAKPDYNNDGDYDIDAVKYKIDLLLELMKDPYLYVNTQDIDPFQGFNEYMKHFDTLHKGYKNCTVAYSFDIDNRKNWKLFWQFFIFIALTVVMYRKEMLAIEDSEPK